jgi:hypothetical protein
MLSQWIIRETVEDATVTDAAHIGIATDLEPVASSHT